LSRRAFITSAGVTAAIAAGTLSRGGLGTSLEAATLTGVRSAGQ
jgi:hypothetical protein